MDAMLMMVPPRADSDASQAAAGHRAQRGGESKVHGPAPPKSRGNGPADQPSPYPRQHAGTPVDWPQGGAEGFGRARDEDKPILLSVGYSACHWCHVMAHESFED